MSKTLKLYIVQANDTLESIAQKMNCTIEEIIRYNRMINRNIFINQPLLIPIEDKKVEIKIKEENRSFTYEKLDLITILFMIKEVLLSALFCIDAYDLLKNKTLDYINRLSDSRSKNNYLEKILVFPTLLLKRDEKIILDYEHKLKLDFDNLKDENEDIFSKEGLKFISEKYQLYILKVGNRNYKEAEKIFDEIINTDYKYL